MSLLTVQRKLQAAGFDPGPLDGLWGRRTEAALDAALAAAGVPSSRPMDGPAAVALIIGDGLSLLPPSWNSPQARLLMLAISGQEADFRHRWQVYDAKRPEAMGAARGLWQFERGGGVRGVLTHERTRTQAAEVCRMRSVSPTVDAVYSALHRDDILAAAFARLLLWTNPNALPAIGQEEAAWQLYLREWRPGAHANGSTSQREGLRRKWAGYYATALATLR